MSEGEYRIATARLPSRESSRAAGSRGDQPKSAALDEKQHRCFAWKAALSGDTGEPSAVDEYLYDDADVLPMTERARRANKRLTAEQ